jgi:uncharacterized protein (TIGR02147 family)
MAQPDKQKLAQNKKAISLLKKVWTRLQEKDSRSWSLRQVARELQISPGYLSKIFSNQMPLTLGMAEKLVAMFKTDDVAKKAILSCFVERTSRAEVLLKKMVPLEQYEIPAESAEVLLKKWYNPIILDLMTTKGFQSSPTWIAQRLDLSVVEVETALKDLIAHDMVIVDKNGAFKKKHLKMRFPASISKVAIREQHKAQMSRAVNELNSKITPKDFNNRLIVGLSVSCNPKHLQEVKEYLHTALYEAAEMLSKDPCTEVYQINLQLFPQTKPS